MPLNDLATTSLTNVALLRRKWVGIVVLVVSSSVLNVWYLTCVVEVLHYTI